MKDEIIQKLIDLVVAYQLAAKMEGLSEKPGWKGLSETVDQIVKITK